MKTGSPTDAVVRYGGSPDALDRIAVSKTETTEHRVTLTGLDPGQRLEQGMGARKSSLPELPASIELEQVPGGHHCHMDESVGRIAARIADFIGAGAVP